MTESKRDLTADLTICNAATDGPWSVYIDGYSGMGGWTEDCNIAPDIARDVYEGGDATFIAEARTGWPHAIERAMAAEAEVERWYQLVRAYTSSYRGAYREYRLFKKILRKYVDDDVWAAASEEYNRELQRLRKEGGR